MKTRIVVDFFETVNRGINDIANIVSSTMGAKGRYVMIKKSYDNVYATKDGVTVADSVDVSSNEYGIGIDLVQQAARTTMDKVGDGTTLTTVLLRGLISKGSLLIKQGMNPVILKQSLSLMINEVINFIKSLSLNITSESQLINIATISANNDKELGKLIGSSLWKSGIHGDIRVEPSFSADTYIKTNIGYTISSGYATKESINYDRGHDVRYNNAYVALFNQKIITFDEIESICSKAMDDKKPLVIIAHGFSNQVIFLLSANNKRGTQFTAISAPSLSTDFKNDIFDDIAILSGATVLPSNDIYNAEYAMGEFDYIHIKSHETSFYDGKGNQEKIADRIKELKGMDLEKMGVNVKTEVSERLAKLTNGLSTLYVGGETDFKLRETMDRIEDAIKATKSALINGYVAGGGVPLLMASKLIHPKMKDKNREKVAKIVKEVLMLPIKVILENAGNSSDSIITKLLNSYDVTNNAVTISSPIIDCAYRSDCFKYINVKGDEVCDCDVDFVHTSNIFGTQFYTNLNLGYDILSDEYGNMIDKGIIDPTEVIIQSIKSAYSIAETFLTCNGLVVEIEN